MLAERQAAGKPKATVALKISQSLGFCIGRAVVSCGFWVAWSCTKARSDQALCLSKSRKYRKTVAVTSQWINLCQSHSIWTSESVWDYSIIEKMSTIASARQRNGKISFLESTVEGIPWRCFWGLLCQPGFLLALSQLDSQFGMRCMHQWLPAYEQLLIIF